MNTSYDEDMTVEDVVRKIRGVINDPNLSEEEREEIIDLVETFRVMVEESETKEDLLRKVNQMIKEHKQ